MSGRPSCCCPVCELERALLRELKSGHVESEYLKSAAREKPTLYEIKDKKPNLVNFDLEGGLYVVPKVIDSGYLVIGKKRVTFTRRGN